MLTDQVISLLLFASAAMAFAIYFVRLRLWQNSASLFLFSVALLLRYFIEDQFHVVTSVSWGFLGLAIALDLAWVIGNLSTGIVNYSAVALKAKKRVLLKIPLFGGVGMFTLSYQTKWLQQISQIPFVVALYLFISLLIILKHSGLVKKWFVLVATFVLALVIFLQTGYTTVFLLSFLIYQGMLYSYNVRIASKVKENYEKVN